MNTFNQAYEIFLYLDGTVIMGFDCYSQISCSTVALVSGLCSTITSTELSSLGVASSTSMIA